MPMENNLNVSELLKRIGVVGNSQASAALLDQLRLSINIANLDHLVPPVGVPVASAQDDNVSGVAVANGWALQCRSAGGLTVLGVIDNNSNTNQYYRWVTDTNPFAASAPSPHANFTFGQPAVSVFLVSTPGPIVAPIPAVDQVFGQQASTHPLNGEIWVGPGQFFNVQARQLNVFNSINLIWKEYPAGLNPT